MASGRLRSRVLPACLLVASAAGPIGCTQPGPLASRQTTMGSLKASVSQLEFDNEGLKKQLADLKADNRRIANELEQEHEANGEVTAQLDDARELIRRQGGNATALGVPTKPASFDDDAIPPPVTRRAKGARKAPSASINNPEPSSWTEPESQSLNRAREVGPQSSLDDDRWLPVARGMGTPVRY